MHQEFDFIILGGGLSGTLMAYQMAADPFFDKKQILLLEKNVTPDPEKTWCFWEDGTGEWDPIVFKKWEVASVAYQNFISQSNLAPYSYKMLRSNDFLNHLKQNIRLKSNIKLAYENVERVEQKTNSCEVTTTENTYQAKLVLNSIFDAKLLKNQKKYPYLKQHFVGWFIKSNTFQFDDSSVKFMDFTVPQKGNTRFMYVLPFSKNEALFEYTLFSEDLLEIEDYQNPIKEYLDAMGVNDYEIVAKEYGNIPMCAFPFHKKNSSNLVHIGTAGGWTKASTGFTFYNTTKQALRLVSYLKTKKDVSRFAKTTRYWWYDLILLEVLHRDNSQGAKIFSTLFKHNSWQSIFVFLNEEGKLKDDLKIMNSLPKGPFIKALFRAVYKMLFKF